MKSVLKKVTQKIYLEHIFNHLSKIKTSLMSFLKLTISKHKSFVVFSCIGSILLLLNARTFLPQYTSINIASTTNHLIVSDIYALIKYRVLSLSCVANKVLYYWANSAAGKKKE